MNQIQHIDELMHTVLDGECSPDQRAELDRLLAQDPAMREKFGSLRALFGVMSKVPRIEPPEDLLDGAIGRFDAIRNNFDAARQLSAGSDVVPSRSKNLQRKHSRANPLISLIQSLTEFVMNDQPSFISTMRGKVVIGAGAVAALAVLVFIGPRIGSSTSDKDTVGTIVAAERYRAAQTAPNDVSTGGTATTSTTGTVDGTAGTVAADSAGLMAGKLDGGKLDGGKLDGGKLDGGKLDGGKLDGGKLDGGKLDGGKLDGGKLDGGKLDGGKLDGGKLDGGKLDGGKLDGGKLDGGKLDPGT